MLMLTWYGRTHLAPLGFCAALLCAPLQRATPQVLAPSGISQSSVSLPRSSEPRNRPSAGKYVLLGTLAGVTAMVGGLLIYFQHNPGDVMNPFGLVPAVLGAGLIGGVTGYIVYRIRY